MVCEQLLVKVARLAQHLADLVTGIPDQPVHRAGKELGGDAMQEAPDLGARQGVDRGWGGTVANPDTLGGSGGGGSSLGGELGLGGGGGGLQRHALPRQGVQGRPRRRLLRCWRRWPHRAAVAAGPPRASVDPRLQLLLLAPLLLCLCPGIVVLGNKAAAEMGAGPEPLGRKHALELQGHAGGRDPLAREQHKVLQSRYRVEQGAGISRLQRGIAGASQHWAPRSWTAAPAPLTSWKARVRSRPGRVMRANRGLNSRGSRRDTKKSLTWLATSDRPTSPLQRRQAGR